MYLLILAISVVAFVGWVAYLILGYKYIYKWLSPAIGEMALLVAIVAVPGLFFGGLYIAIAAGGKSGANWFLGVFGVAICVLGASVLKRGIK